VNAGVLRVAAGRAAVLERRLAAVRERLLRIAGAGGLLTADAATADRKRGWCGTRERKRAARSGPGRGGAADRRRGFVNAGVLRVAAGRAPDRERRLAADRERLLRIAGAGGLLTADAATADRNAGGAALVNAGALRVPGAGAGALPIVDARCCDRGRASCGSRARACGGSRTALLPIADAAWRGSRTRRGADRGRGRGADRGRGRAADRGPPGRALLARAWVLERGPVLLVANAQNKFRAAESARVAMARSSRMGLLIVVA
jgi:hypothetical protein